MFLFPYFGNFTAFPFKKGNKANNVTKRALPEGVLFPYNQRGGYMKPFDLKTQKQYFIAMLTSAVVIIFAIMMMYVWRVNLLTFFPGCLFKEVTGYDCPGCGGTRAVVALLQGHTLESFCYHPIVPYTVTLQMAVIISGCLRKWTTYTHTFLLRPVHFYAFIVLLIANFFIKNLMRACL